MGTVSSLDSCTYYSLRVVDVLDISKSVSHPVFEGNNRSCCQLSNLGVQNSWNSLIKISFSDGSRNATLLISNLNIITGVENCGLSTVLFIYFIHQGFLTDLLVHVE